MRFAADYRLMKPCVNHIVQSGSMCSVLPISVLSHLIETLPLPIHFDINLITLSSSKSLDHVFQVFTFRLTIYFPFFHIFPFFFFSSSSPLFQCNSGSFLHFLLSLGLFWSYVCDFWLMIGNSSRMSPKHYLSLYTQTLFGRPKISRLVLNRLLQG